MQCLPDRMSEEQLVTVLESLPFLKVLKMTEMVINQIYFDKN